MTSGITLNSTLIAGSKQKCCMDKAKLQRSEKNLKTHTHLQRSKCQCHATSDWALSRADHICSCIIV